MKYLIPILCLSLGACATQQRTYQPPDSTKLKASTQRVSKAVEASHTAAKKAQASVNAAAALAKKNREAVSKLKNVPPEVLQGLSDQESKLAEAQANQKELEQHLVEADAARAQVEKDKSEYFTNAQKLADAATNENAHRVKAEKSLSWYRWHFFLGWILLGSGIVACAAFAFIKFSGKFMLLL